MGIKNETPNNHNTAIVGNGSGIAEGGELEVQILNIAQMINRSTTLDFSTASPLLAMCCYMLCFSNFQ